MGADEAGTLARLLRYEPLSDAPVATFTEVFVFSENSPLKHLAPERDGAWVRQILG